MATLERMLAEIWPPEFGKEREEALGSVFRKAQDEVIEGGGSAGGFSAAKALGQAGAAYPNAQHLGDQI